MIWRVAGDQLLVERGESRFALVDATGAIVREYLPSDWAYDEDSGRERYVVQGGELRRQTFTQHGGGRTSSEDEPVLRDLEVADTPEARQFVATAFADAAVVAEERRLATERAAIARVAGIEGAARDLGLGADVARAQRALRDRVYDYADEHAAMLLRTLIALARAGVRGGALVQYCSACLYVTFANAPRLDDGEPTQGHAPALIAVIEAHADVLARASDYQDFIDAPNTASAYAAAAACLRRAAAMLAR